MNHETMLLHVLLDVLYHVPWNNHDCRKLCYVMEVIHGYFNMPGRAIPVELLQNLENLMEYVEHETQD